MTAGAPKSVKVGVLTYTIVWSDADVNAAAVAARHALLGHTDHDQLKIEIMHSIAPMRQKGVLLHEILHCVWPHTWDTDENSFRASEENVITEMETKLLGVLQENPQVMEWLLKED